MADTPALAAARPLTPCPLAPLVVGTDLLRGAAPEHREMLLRPALSRASLTLLYGARGIGKTFLSLSIALAVASGGSALRWRAERPARVLHVDGEMPRAVLVERLAALAAGAGLVPAGDALRLLASEGDTASRIDLGTEDGRARIAEACESIDLLILDSLSVLLRDGRANPGRTWLQVEDWLLGLRRRGLAVLVVRNATTGGDLSEVTRHADVMDTAIALRRPDDYEAFEGARFDLTFTKGRSLLGTEAQPFEAALYSKDGLLRWFVSSRADALSTRAAGLFFEGYSVREVATRLRVSKSKAHLLAKEILAEAKRRAAVDTAGTDFGQHENAED